MEWKANNNYPEQIAEALLHAVGHDENIENGEGSPEYEEYTAEKNQLEDALYQLMAICQNPYNMDHYRTFYNVLDELTDCISRRA